jgi:hypothetical protein
VKGANLEAGGPDAVSVPCSGGSMLAGEAASVPTGTYRSNVPTGTFVHAGMYVFHGMYN